MVNSYTPPSPSHPQWSRWWADNRWGGHSKDLPNWFPCSWNQTWWLVRWTLIYLEWSLIHSWHRGYNFSATLSIPTVRNLTGKLILCCIGRYPIICSHFWYHPSPLSLSPQTFHCAAIWMISSVCSLPTI